MDLSYYVLAGICVVSLFCAAFNAAIGPTGGAMIAGLSLLLPPPLALTLQAIGNIIGTSLRSFSFRQYIERKAFVVLLAGLLPGAALAYILFQNIPEWFLQIGIATFLLVITWLPKSKKSQPAHLTDLFWASLLSSAFSNFFGGGMAWLAQATDRYFKSREKTLAHVNITAFVQNCMKATFLIGVFDFQPIFLMTLSAMVLVCMYVGHIIGMKLGNKLDEALWRQILKYTITCIALVILFNALLTFV